MAGSIARLGARFVHSTTLIDRAYRGFDRLRSLLVLAFASDAFLVAHSQRVYEASSSYRADAPNFRHELFQWERTAVEKFFPAPSARVLLGGAGGGREAYELCRMGYRVVAFEPAPVLVRSMQERARREFPGTLDAYRAAYADLPIMPAAAGSPAVDLRREPPFDAAILGWISFSHLLQDSERVGALAAFGELTRGPILVSYFSDATENSGAPGGRWPLSALRRRAARRGASMFTTGIGYIRLLTETELRSIVERAGLEIVHLDRDAAYPHAILRRVP